MTKGTTVARFLTRQRLQICLALVFGLAATTMGARAEDLLDQIKKRGKVVVATQAAYAPFEFIQDGKIVGYDKDVLDRVVAAWGVTLEQLDLPFAGILTGLDQRKYDFVCTGLIMNPERAAKYAFTFPVAAAPVALLKRKGDTNVKSIEDLSGLTIGGPIPPSGTTAVFTAYAKSLSQNGKGPDKIVHFQGSADAFLALGNGQVDAALETVLVLREVIRKQPDKFEILGTIGKPFYYGWVTRTEDTAFRDAISAELRRLRDSGELAQLQQKWFGFTMELPDSGYLPEGAK